MGLQLGRAIRIVMQTKPYVLYRAMTYGVLCLCLVAYLGVVAAIGAVFGAGAFWVLSVVSLGLVVVLGATGFVGEYIFYRLRAGHIALITEIITEGHAPVGISQTKWASGRVLHYFADADLLPQIRQAIRSVIRTANRQLFDASQALPVPYIECGAKFGQHLANFSQDYLTLRIVSSRTAGQDELAFSTGFDMVIDLDRTIYTFPWVKTTDLGYDRQVGIYLISFQHVFYLVLA